MIEPEILAKGARAMHRSDRAHRLTDLALRPDGAALIEDDFLANRARYEHKFADLAAALEDQGLKVVES